MDGKAETKGVYRVVVGEFCGFQLNDRAEEQPHSVMIAVFTPAVPTAPP
jgi:hypothetical protein